MCSKMYVVYILYYVHKHTNTPLSPLAYALGICGKISLGYSLIFFDCMPGEMMGRQNRTTDSISLIFTSIDLFNEAISMLFQLDTMTVPSALLFVLESGVC